MEGRKEREKEREKEMEEGREGGGPVSMYLFGCSVGFDKFE